MKNGEWRMENGELLDLGRVIAPSRAGLRIDVDWERFATAEIYPKVQFEE